MPQPFKPDTQSQAPFPIVELQSVDSTNNYARKLINEGLARSGDLIFAHEQIAGKGRRGKAWQSERDQNILMSILADPAPLTVSAQFQLSAISALASLLFFSKKAGKETRIKWPNDIYWQDRKAGGILIENILSGNQWKWAIVGIGININQSRFPEDLSKAISLKQITGEEYDPLSMAGELFLEFTRLWQALDTNGFAAILEHFNSCLYKKGEKAKFRKGPRVFEAIVKEVNSSGELIIDHGVEEKYRSGEIEWLID